MNNIRRYFQHHPFVHWLTTVVITSALMLSAGLLTHEKDWPIIVVFAAGVPTAALLTRNLFR